MTGADEVPLLADQLRRYSFAYTAAHDQSVCDDIMVEDYTLHMGDIVITGRDDHYKPAARKQYRQFPGLGMSVHALLITPDRAALHFSEYGRSVLSGTTAAWSGISMYHWNGARLVDCRVEQDYYARRAQLRSGTPHAVDRPAHDPWAVAVEQPDPTVRDTVRQWLGDGGIATLPCGALDDEPFADAARIQLDWPAIEVLDCFSAADRAGFHVSATGPVSAWPGADQELLGRTTTVYYAGIAQVVDGAVTQARVISDRLAAERRLAPAG